jgi:hypothetical protein
VVRRDGLEPPEHFSTGFTPRLHKKDGKNGKKRYQR